MLAVIREPAFDGVDESITVNDADHASRTGTAHAEQGAFRAGFVAGGVALAACTGLVLFSVLHTDDSGPTTEHRAPAAPVSYEVTGKGTADITYQARNTSGKATVVEAATLPWHTTVDVPLGQHPSVSIVLTQQGGQARCTLTIRHPPNRSPNRTDSTASTSADVTDSAASSTSTRMRSDQLGCDNRHPQVAASVGSRCTVGSPATAKLSSPAPKP
jgi:hypothetical protein